MAVRVVPLGSGSQGNATLLEFGSTRLLVDAGLSERDLVRRLAAVGVPAGSIQAVLLSHEHHDHARGIERFAVRHRVPTLCPVETLEALNLSPIHLPGWQPIVPGRRLDLGPVRVETFSVPHDAACPLGFVVEGEGVRVGIATDLGHVTTVVAAHLRGCHVLLVESNHDDGMLLGGPYPWPLKQRISGRMGHLSNIEAARLLAEVADGACRAVILAHLSEKNNTPALARATAANALADGGLRRLEMRVAQPRHPTPAVCL